MIETMKIDGGLSMYTTFDLKSQGLDRYNIQKSPYGRKVSFNNFHGMDGELEYARKFFTEDQVLTIKEIYIGRSRSDVEFIEYPNKKFNTVMFTDL